MRYIDWVEATPEVYKLLFENEVVRVIEMSLKGWSDGQSTLPSRRNGLLHHRQQGENLIALRQLDGG
jgi:hypothetical protein